MTDKEKKVIFALVAIMVIILLIVVVSKMFGEEEDIPKTNVSNNQSTTSTVQNEEKYVTQLNNGTKLNNSNDLKQTKKYKNLEISEIQVTSNNGNSVILANVKNIGSINFKKEIVRLTLYGDNQEVLTEFDAIMPGVDAGQTGQLNVMVTSDIANIKDFKIEAK